LRELSSRDRNVELRAVLRAPRLTLAWALDERDDMRLNLSAVVWSVGVLAACQVAEPAASPTPTPTPAPVAVATASAPTAAPAAPASSAAPVAAPAPSPGARKFDEDVTFLSEHGAGVKVLQSTTGSRIAISGKYQARVMTSAVEAQGASLGFINRSFIEAGKTGTAFDNFGGEDRFWLGPEGGQFALYFPAGKPFEFGNWQTPHAFQEGEWQEKAASASASATTVTFARAFSVTNYAKTEFKVDVERKVSLLSGEQAKAALGLDVPAGVKWVGFSTENALTNKGTKAWTEDKGLPSVWILGMFNPAPGTRIIAPFDKSGTGEVVNDRYFGKIAADRLQVNQDKGFVVFKADGQSRGKIGLPPTRAKSVLGSYSSAGQVLTIVRFTKPAGAKRYVNNLWEVSKEPYGGDVANAYNDGPVEPGKPSLGGFYELESSSPAAALAPGAKLVHTHETYHFTGPKEALEAIARHVLGVSLTDVQNVAL
jgi:hypothetical protein